MQKDFILKDLLRKALEHIDRKSAEFHSPNKLELIQLSTCREECLESDLSLTHLVLQYYFMMLPLKSLHYFL